MCVPVWVHLFRVGVQDSKTNSLSLHPAQMTPSTRGKLESLLAAEGTSRLGSEAGPTRPCLEVARVPQAIQERVIWSRPQPQRRRASAQTPTRGPEPRASCRRRRRRARRPRCHGNGGPFPASRRRRAVPGGLGRGGRC